VNPLLAFIRLGATTLLDIEKIKQLIEMMVENDLSEMALRDGEEEIKLRRPGSLVEAPGVPLRSALVSAATPEGEPAGMAMGEEGAEAGDEAGLLEIKSPMVGTFYSSPDPESPPFVEMGSPVQAETVVCIVEAMKVFNEIKAEVAGTIDRILVQNEQPVEYGQALFLVRPA
jgi:acetyl-CoA carboxylase biotin carboxyl carrier protein